MASSAVRYQELEAKYRLFQGRRKEWEPYTPAQFEEELQELTLLDERGVRWAIHPETGEWFHFDGREWVDGVRPASAEATSTRRAGPGPTSASRQWENASWDCALSWIRRIKQFIAVHLTNNSRSST